MSTAKCCVKQKIKDNEREREKRATTKEHNINKKIINLESDIQLIYHPKK